jgi:hypothetical protein
MKTQIAQRIASPLYWAPIMRGVQKKGEIAFMIRSLTSLGDMAPAFAKTADRDDIVPPPGGRAISPIPGPKVPASNPDRHLFCEEAIEEAFQNVAALAEATGWDGNEVAAALVSLADHHLMGRIANRKLNDVIARLSSNDGHSQALRAVNPAGRQSWLRDTSFPPTNSTGRPYIWS